MSAGKPVTWNSDTSFRCVIDGDSRDALDDGLKRGELCLAVSVKVGDVVHMGDLYSDGMTTGKLTFELEGDAYVRVKIKGTFELDFSIDGSENEQVREARAPLICTCLSDPEANFHDVEGTAEDGVEIGKIAGT